MSTFGQDKVYNNETAEELKKQGYKRVSNRFRIVSRCDLSDEDLMALFKKKNVRVKVLTEGWRDWYRRCLSQDTMTVPESIYKKLPGTVL